MSPVDDDTMVVNDLKLTSRLANVEQVIAFARDIDAIIEIGKTS